MVDNEICVHEEYQSLSSGVIFMHPITACSLAKTANCRPFSRSAEGSKRREIVERNRASPRSDPPTVRLERRIMEGWQGIFIIRIISSFSGRVNFATHRSRSTGGGGWKSRVPAENDWRRRSFHRIGVSGCG